jgi:hypothetical protein
MTPRPKPAPSCRKCQEPLPLDADGKKKYPGRVCRVCKYAAVARLVREQIPKQTPAAARKARKYATEAAVFLDDHHQCAACVPVHFDGQMCHRLKSEPATDIHHTHGRLGELLNYKPWWLPVCRACHLWIHGNPLAARLIQARGFDLRLLCGEGEWNTKPSGNP